MRRRLQGALARLVQARNDGARLALLFDYDGTLAPIVERPAAAALTVETRYRLERLALTPSVCIGVLSGRTLDDLRDRVGIDCAYYAGTSGLEVAFGPTPILHPDHASAIGLIVDVAISLRLALADYAGAWLEEKPLGLTVHFRDVAPHRIAALQIQTAEALIPFAGALRTFDGPMSLEITPDRGWTKGTALGAILEHIPGEMILPLYAGDHANDADALLAAADLGGVAIGVGPDAPRSAQYRVPDSGALGCCLDALLQMLTDTSADSFAAL